MFSHEVRNFSFGIIDTVEDKAIPDGAASASLNWITLGDRIELSRGMARLGVTENQGNGGILGTRVANKADGTQIPFRKNGQKCEYYDSVTDDWIECGSNMFPTAAANDEASFASYFSLAGAQLFVTTPNSGPFKIMTANPASFTDLTDASKNFQGYIKIKQNRMFLWGRLKDLTGIYGSYIDAAQYTTVSGEATTSLTGTLAFKAGGPVRTCFGVVITLSGSGEVYTDNYNGVLTGSLGGTGTINYTTGDYTLSNPGVGTATYQWENSNNQGVTDFTKAGTRLAGQGFVFRQDDGGALLNVLSYGDAEYCLHEQKTWVLTLTATDTNATNLIYRDKVGIPNWRAAVETGSGIFFVDTSNKTDPQIRLLALSQFSVEVIPVAISKHLFHTRANAKGIKTAMTFGIELGTYHFEKAVVWEWGNYILVACKSQNATQNDTIILYHKLLGSLDKRAFFVNDLATYNGTLLAADSISNNCYTLFSGFDDDNSNITNVWDGNLSELQMADLKKAKKLRLQGAIGPDQNYQVWLSLDKADFVFIGIVSGAGSYVDRGTQVEVGTNTIGSNKVGGGGDGAVAYNYYCQLPIRQDKFEKAKIRFIATDVGYVSINNYTFFNIIPMQTRIPRRYRVAA